MTVQILALDLLATLVLTINNLVEATFIVSIQVFIDDDSCALLVRAVNSSKWADKFVRLHLFPLDSYLAAIFKEALTFVGAINNFKWAIHVNVVLKVTLLNLDAAFVFARDNRLWAFI